MNRIPTEKIKRKQRGTIFIWLLLNLLILRYNVTLEMSFLFKVKFYENLPLNVTDHLLLLQVKYHMTYEELAPDDQTLTVTQIDFVFLIQIKMFFKLRWNFKTNLVIEVETVLNPVTLKNLVLVAKWSLCLCYLLTLLFFLEWWILFGLLRNHIYFWLFSRIDDFLAKFAKQKSSIICAFF